MLSTRPIRWTTFRKRSVKRSEPDSLGEATTDLLAVRPHPLNTVDFRGPPLLLGSAYRPRRLQGRPEAGLEDYRRVGQDQPEARDRSRGGSQSALAMLTRHERLHFPFRTTSAGTSRRFQDRRQALHGVLQSNGSGCQGGLPGRDQGGLVGRTQEAEEERVVEVHRPLESGRWSWVSERMVGWSRRRESLPFFSLSILFTESSTSSSFSFAEYGSFKNVLLL